MQSELKASYTDCFEHAFDAKGRITVPSEWRGERFEKHLVAFPGKECVKVYPESWMNRQQQKIADLKMGDPLRQKFELLASIAQTVEWDQQGRMMIKERLRQAAGLKKEAILVGVGDHFEVWDAKVRAERSVANITLEEAAEALGI